MRPTLRGLLLLGISLCLIYFAWLWQPERQVRLHTAHLLHKIDIKDWSSLATDLSADYRDDWNGDRALLLARLRELLSGRDKIDIIAHDANIRVEGRAGVFRAKITIEGEGEIVSMIKPRINSLATPFELQWRRQSGQPWDWKLVRVSNSELQLPAD